MNSWERQRDPETDDLEPVLWFARFEAFRLQGPSRSLVETVNRERDAKGRHRTRHSPTSWRRAYHRWRWVERAQDWDLHVAEEAEREWLRFREGWRDKERGLAEALVEKAEQMMRFPVARATRTGEDGAVTIVEPAGWTFATIRGLAETASRLARLASEMETDRQHVTLDMVLDVLPGELREQIVEQLAEALREAGGG